MEVFVSGQITDLDNVRAVQDALLEAGHTITHDWTRNETGDQMLAGRQAKLDNPEEAARRAVADMEGVIECDAYVICTDNENMGKGMYVELGGAIALHETQNRPAIYMLGKMAHMSIFYLHPAVTHLGSTKELIAELTQ